MPLEAGVLRHADEGIHTWPETPQARGPFYPEVDHGSGRALRLAGAHHRGSDALRRGVVHHEPRATQSSVLRVSKQKGDHEHQEGHTGAHPCIGAMDVHGHRPEDYGDVVEVPEALVSLAAPLPGGRVGDHGQEEAERNARKPDGRPEEELLDVRDLLSGLLRHWTSWPQQGLVEAAPEPAVRPVRTRTAQDRVNLGQLEGRLMRLRDCDDRAEEVADAVEGGEEHQHPPAKRNVKLLVRVKHAAHNALWADDD
mmetsp:Transcript_139536/g.389191  ORF Transcript_139536/g.389191 Transcript_139536/m.389191 type:complete len:254 (+) Transcript_139536:1088-1849(+)